MKLHRIALLGLATALAVPFAPDRAAAAEAYDSCRGFIAAVPAVVNTPGTWCLNKDLATVISSGVAISIGTANVTIDCNGFKLVGLLGGIGTTTRGISSTYRNTTVRNCDIRGYWHGTSISAVTALVEDNRFDANRLAGVYGDGDGYTIRRNIITNSGGSPGDYSGFGILTTGSGDILDNTIVGVTNSQNEGYTYGISVSASHGGTVRGNRIRTLTAPDIGLGAGILVEGGSDGVAIEGNVIHVGPDDYFQGIVCISVESGMARGNSIQGRFYSGVNGCSDGGDNYINATIP